MTYLILEMQYHFYLLENFYNKMLKKYSKN